MANNSSTAQPKGFTCAPWTNLTAKLIAGTEGNPQQPFFSPDGKWIGYCSVSWIGKLKKIAISGGAPVTLCDVANTLATRVGVRMTRLYIGRWTEASCGFPPTEELRNRSLRQKVRGYLLSANSAGWKIRAVHASDTPPTQRLWCSRSNRGSARNCSQAAAARYLPTGHHRLCQLGNNIFSPFRLILTDLRCQVDRFPLLKVFRGSASQYAVSDSGTLVYMPETSATAAALDAHSCG